MPEIDSDAQKTKKGLLQEIKSLRERLHEPEKPKPTLIAYSADSDRLFRSKAATCSDSFRPLVPDDSGHPFGVTLDDGFFSQTFS